MIHIYINRIYREQEQVRGNLTLYKDGIEKFNCKTLELGWKNNTPNKSCIPPNPSRCEEYSCVRLESSPSFNYPHLWLQDVKGRTYIKVHKGNYYDEILGCILVGDGFYDLDSDGLKDVTNSGITLEKIMGYIEKDDEIKITIRWVDVLV